MTYYYLLFLRARVVVERGSRNHEILADLLHCRCAFREITDEAERRGWCLGHGKRGVRLVLFELIILGAVWFAHRICRHDVRMAAWNPEECSAAHRNHTSKKTWIVGEENMFSPLSL